MDLRHFSVSSSIMPCTELALSKYFVIDRLILYFKFYPFFNFSDFSVLSRGMFLGSESVFLTSLFICMRTHTRTPLAFLDPAVRKPGVAPRRRLQNPACGSGGGRGPRPQPGLICISEGSDSEPHHSDQRQ